MSTTNWIFTYFASLAASLAIDLIWLGIVARGIYRDRMGDLLADKPNLPVAMVFYALFVLGVLYLAVAPGIDEGSFGVALRNGALFGLFTYATYDLTNLAVLKGYPASIAVIDITWGVALASAVASIGYTVARGVS